MERADSGTVPGTRTARLRRWLGRRARPRWGEEATGRSPWARGRILAALAVPTSALLAFHSTVPNTVGRFGSLLETFLPWLGLAVPLLLVLALLRRSATALAALLLPAAVWGSLFGGRVAAGDGGAHDVTAVQHNVSDVNADPAGTARTLRDSGPDLIALEELTPAALPVYERELAPEYAHRAVRGTVGLWSKHPLTEVGAVDIRPEGIGDGWNRGVRATARTPWGDVAVYVAHLPSVRVQLHGFSTGRRDESAGLLGAALAAEKLEKVILLGDFNGTVDDRGLDPVTTRVDSVGRDHFAFSWPAAFPVSRIDHVMTRSATVTHVRTLPATGSDHLPVAAGITLDP
ncbi:endonuclease/exonuclease/phosphatase family protein [Streptomyces sp. NPDC058471]|uniref:endonuclease/exonuclease/phosphatase family protein n=1 Tax=Streptomyces sp. NPDC058471 TaxID=3346516 RepID=UPI003668EB65